MEHVVRLSMESLPAEIKRAFRANGITEESLKINSILKARNSILECAATAWLKWQKEMLNISFQNSGTFAKILPGLLISPEAEKSLTPNGISSSKNYSKENILCVGRQLMVNTDLKLDKLYHFIDIKVKLRIR